MSFDNKIMISSHPSLHVCTKRNPQYVLVIIHYSHKTMVHTDGINDGMDIVPTNFLNANENVPLY